MLWRYFDLTLLLFWCYFDMMLPTFGNDFYRLVFESVLKLFGIYFDVTDQELVHSFSYDLEAIFNQIRRILMHVWTKVWRKFDESLTCFRLVWGLLCAWFEFVTKVWRPIDVVDSFEALLGFFWGSSDTLLNLFCLMLSLFSSMFCLILHWLFGDD